MIKKEDLQSLLGAYPNIGFKIMDAPSFPLRLKLAGEAGLKQAVEAGKIFAEQVLNNQKTIKITEPGISGSVILIYKVMYHISKD
jgi:hypothetical protein